MTYPNPCNQCSHKAHTDGGHCYMFRSAPTTACAQYKPTKLALRGAAAVLAAVANSQSANNLITDSIPAKRDTQAQMEFKIETRTQT